LSAKGFQTVSQQVLPPPRRDDDRYLSIFVASNLQQIAPVP
jgi:hypothetical protein